MSWTKIIARSLWLRCAACGRGKPFTGLFTMAPKCNECGTTFDRAPGYFLGSIYFNYAITAILATAGYFALYFSEVVSPTTALWIVGPFCVLFPIWFFRYARSLWMGFDQIFDPAPLEQAAKKRPAAEPTNGRAR